MTEVRMKRLCPAGSKKLQSWVMDGCSKNGFLSRMNLEVTGSIMWTLWSAALGGFFFFFWCFVLVRKRNCFQRLAYLQKCLLDVCSWFPAYYSISSSDCSVDAGRRFDAKTTEDSLTICPLNIQNWWQTLSCLAVDFQKQVIIVMSKKIISFLSQAVFSVQAPLSFCKERATFGCSSLHDPSWSWPEVSGYLSNADYPGT